MGGCVIHFGMHKTGSSSIQRSLAGARDIGPDHRFITLGRRSGNLSSDLLTAFADEPWDADTKRRRGTEKEQVLRERPGVRARLREAVAATGERTAVISGETLSEWSERELARLARALERAAESVSAVGYVRPPADRMASAFQQGLRAGFDRFEPAEFYAGYRRLEAFDNVFGRERVSIWKFDPTRFPQGDVVRDFCGRLGIPITDDDVVRVNEALSRPAMSILFAYRVYGPGYGVGSRAVRENRALIEALWELSGPKFAFDDSAVAPVVHANLDDLAWIEERLGEELRSDAREGIASAEELLEIEPAAVSAFMEAVRRRFGIEPPGSGADRVDTDPRVVAELVQHYRDSIREVLFGPDAESEAHDSAHRSARYALVARRNESASNWRQGTGDTIVFVPTARRAAIVAFESSGECDAPELEFTAQVQSSDAPPLALSLSLAGDGEDVRVLDEIRVAGRADRAWRVRVPPGTGAQDLRLRCALTAGASQGRRARVRVTRPALGPAAR
jgi:hypothetical protein